MTHITTLLLVWALILPFIGVPLAIGTSIWIDRAGKRADEYYKREYMCWRNVFRSIAAVGVAASAMLLFWSFNEVQTEGVGYETDLNAQYVQNINILSNYVSGYHEQLGVANLQSNQIKAIITEAVAGQVDVKDLVAPGKSPLFIAVSQAYPTVTGAQYQQLIDYIQAGRQQFQDGQTNLLHDLSTYDSWQHSGFLIQPSMVSALGFPTNLLHVDVGGKAISGAAAEARMWKIVENPTAEAAFATGTMEPLTVSK